MERFERGFGGGGFNPPSGRRLGLQPPATPPPPQAPATPPAVLATPATPPATVRLQGARLSLARAAATAEAVGAGYETLVELLGTEQAQAALTQAESYLRRATAEFEKARQVDPPDPRFREQVRRETLQKIQAIHREGAAPPPTQRLPFRVPWERFVRGG